MSWTKKYENRKSELQAQKPVTNFSMFELVDSNTARLNGVEEQYWPDESFWAKAERYLPVIQLLRDKMDVPIRISSCYRSPKLNKLVGGSRTSDHMAKGDTIAFDLQTNNANISWLNTPNQNLYELIIEHVKSAEIPAFKQLIHEFGSDSEPAWVHLAFSESNPKKQVLTIKRGTGYEDITDEVFEMSEYERYISLDHVELSGKVTASGLIVRDRHGKDTGERLRKGSTVDPLDIVEIEGQRVIKIS